MQIWFQNELVRTGLGTDITMEIPEAKLWSAEKPAKPNPVESYVGTECETYYGQAQAVIRGVKPGTVKLTVADDKGHTVSERIKVM